MSYDDNFDDDLEDHHIFTFQDIVVTYSTPIALFSPKKLIEKKLREILAANPDANLKKHQRALEIKIIDVQRKRRPPPPKPKQPEQPTKPKKESIYISFDEE